MTIGGKMFRVAKDGEGDAGNAAGAGDQLTLADASGNAAGAGDQS